jgi:hypothetical protein
MKDALFTHKAAPKGGKWLAFAALAALAACAPQNESATPPLVDEIAAEASPGVEPSPYIEGSPPTDSGRYRGAPRRGVLTAGDIDDGLNFAAFQRYLGRAGAALDLPRADFGAPVLAQLIGADGDPAPGVRFTLRRPGAAEPFWSGYSGVDGRIAVFPAMWGAGNLRNVELRAFGDESGQGGFSQTIATGRYEQVALPFEGEWEPDFLDLVFVVDATGSMGDEIAWLRRELRAMVQAARRAAPGADIRYGLVVYRDRGDDFVVRNYGFTGSQSQMLGWLNAQEAAGGGDYPEAAAAALSAAAELPWRRGKGERILVHLADAPPHRGEARAYLAAARRAAGKDVQIFALGASGVAEESEFLMRQAALQTQGRYIFLTDDSGVGASHAEPTIACYRVTALTRLMARLLRSEMEGRRIEAGSGEVVREVGTYRAGVCLN